jgi:hypothetical protein
LVRRPLSGLLYQPRTIDDECGAIGGMKIGRRNRNTRRKPVPVPLCPPQIPHDVTWALAGPIIIITIVISDHHCSVRQMKHHRLVVPGSPSSWSQNTSFLCYIALVRSTCIERLVMVVL